MPWTQLSKLGCVLILPDGTYADGTFPSHSTLEALSRTGHTFPALVAA